MDGWDKNLYLFYQYYKQVYFLDYVGIAFHYDIDIIIYLGSLNHSVLYYVFSLTDLFIEIILLNFC